jgi:RNA polymerase sigma-70 factor (ECF subfamily)
MAIPVTTDAHHAATGPDDDVVAKARAGDQAAQAALYRRYVALVAAYCRTAAREPAAAADLVHESFLRAFTRLPALRRDDRFAAWLIGVTRSVCREWQRANRRYRRRLQIARELAPRGEQAAGPPADRSDIEAAEHRDRLYDALAGLPHRERLALHAMYAFDGDIARVGEVLQISRATAYRVVARARERLTRVLGDTENA